MADGKSVVLITGVNGGIGFELAAQLLAKGNYHVLVGARSQAKGEAAVQNLQSCSYPGKCELLNLDVTDDDSIARAVKTVPASHGRLDCLVNNVAIAPLDLPTRQRMRDAFETNVISVEFLTSAFLPLLKSFKTTARIVNVSSGLGSITTKNDHSQPYPSQHEVTDRSSKSALNMVTACQTYELKHNLQGLSCCRAVLDSRSRISGPTTPRLMGRSQWLEVRGHWLAWWVERKTMRLGSFRMEARARMSGKLI